MQFPMHKNNIIQVTNLFLNSIRNHCKLFKIRLETE